MYNLLIVDDDAIIRQGLIKNIDWHTYKINVVGSASDGEKAINMIEENVVDIVITDIKMPFLDGLELATHIYHHYPHIKIILLSGYKEFEYARKAISLNIKDYLLKPIDNNKLKDIIIKIVNEIDREYINNKRLSDSKLLERQNFLKMWVENSKYTEEEQILEKLEFHKISTFKYMQLAVIRCNDYFNNDYHNRYMEGSLLKFAIWNIANELVKELQFGIVFEYLSDQILMIYSYPKNNMNFKLNFENIITKLVTNVSDHLSSTITIGISSIFHKKTDLYIAYSQCQKTFQFVPFHSGLPFIYYDALDYIQKGYNTHVNRFLSSLRKVLSNPLENNLLDNLYNQLEADLNKQSMFYKESIHLLFTYMSFQIHHLLIEQLDINELKYEKMIEEHLAYLTIFNNIKDIVNANKTFLFSYLREAYDEHNACQDSHINKAIAYIKDNYKDEDLRLKKVASYIHVNPSYLSILFKKHKGTSFSDYLLKLRMENASRLLTFTSDKISEISDAVGFSNAQYFSASFKNFFGKTPKEYRAEKRS